MEKKFWKSGPWKFLDTSSPEYHGVWWPGSLHQQEHVFHEDFKYQHNLSAEKWYKMQIYALNHCGLVTPNGDRDLSQQWLR